MTATALEHRLDERGPGAQASAPASGDRYRLWRAGGVAMAVAVGGTVLAYATARALGVSFLMAPAPGAAPAPLPAALVVLASALGALAGAAARGLLGRLAPRRPWLFTAVGVAFLLLSLAGPLTVEGADAATRVALTTLHVIAGGSTILALHRLARPDPS